MLEHRKVEADRVADQQAAAEEFLEKVQGFGKTRRAAHRFVADAVDRGGRSRDRPAGIDEGGEGFFRTRSAQRNRHASKLDDARVSGVEAGGLDVDRHRLDRCERHGAAHGPFTLPLHEPQCGIGGGFSHREEV